MQPAAFLSVVIKAEGVAKTIADIRRVDSQLRKVKDVKTVTLSAKVDDKGFKEFKAKIADAEKMSATARLEAEVVDQGFEDFGLKVKIAGAQEAHAKLHADVVDQGFEDFGLKTKIADAQEATATLRAEIEDIGFEEFGLKTKIADAQEATATLRAEVFEEGFDVFMADIMAARAAAAKDVVQTLRFDVDAAPAMGTSAGASAVGGASGGGATSSAGGAALGSILWGSHGGGRRMPAPWWARLATGGGMLAGAGTAGSFAGFGAEHFLTTLGAVAGSGGSALAGGGLIGLGAAGNMAVGGGSDMLVNRSVIAGATELGKLYDSLKEKVAIYGKNSEEAEHAQAKLNYAMKLAGPAAEAELNISKKGTHMKEMFNSMSEEAKKESAHLIMGVMSTAEAFIPAATSAAADNLKIVNHGIKPLFEWLKGPEGMGIWNTLEDNFKKNLPASVHALTQVIEFFLKTIAAASQYTGGFTKKLDEFFSKWNQPKFFAKWEVEIGKLVKDFRVWGDFVQALAKVIYDLFSQDVGTGKGIIKTLTGMLEKLDEWETSVSGKENLHNIFQVHKEETIALLRVLPPLISALTQIYMTIAPPMVEAVVGILKAVTWLLTALIKLGPAVKFLLGFIILAAKLKILVPILSFVGTQIGVIGTESNATLAAVERLTIAMEALAVAQGEVAATGEAAAGAMTMEGLGAGAATATTEAGILAEGGIGGTGLATGAAATASKWMSGFMRAIPIVAGAYSIGNLMTSVLAGDMQDAGFELGGSLVGGILGFMVGGPAGAMLGAGLGSFAGEFASSLFSGQELSEPTGIKEMLDANMHAIRAGTKSQKHAVKAYSKTTQELGHTHKHVKQATENVKDAEGDLNRIRKSDAGNTQKMIKAEIRLKEARHAVKDATQDEIGLERLSKSEKRAIMNITANQAVKSLEAIHHIREEREELNKLLTTQQQHHVGVDKEEKTIDKIAKTQRKQKEAQAALNAAFTEAGVVGPKYQNNLEKTVKMQRDSIEKGLIDPLKVLDRKQRHFTSVAHDNWEKFTETGNHSFEKLALKAEEKMGVVEGVVIKSGKKMGPFETETTKAMRKSRLATESFSDATAEGMVLAQGIVEEFATELGITGGTFKSKKGKGKGKHNAGGKERGGFINIGDPVGDSVHAMLEKGEYVLNRNAVAKAGIHNLNKLNYGVAPRGMQSGGSVDLMGSNMSVGDEPQILSDLYKLSSSIAKTMYVISGYRTPQHSVEVGGFADDPHTRGEAADVGAGSAMRDSMFGVSESTLKKIGLYRPFYPPSAAEVNHVQLFGSQAAGAKGNIIGGGAGAVPQMPHIAFQGPEGKLTEIGQGTMNSITEVAQKFLNKNAPKGGAGLLGNVPTGPIQKMAHEMVSQIWDGSQWPSFEALEMSEAGWNPSIENTSSGAAGLAQALPASKYPPGAWPYQGLESAKLQLQWMMGYIKERYGDPSSAWAFHQANNWYQKGGEVTGMLKGGPSPESKAIAEAGHEIKGGIKDIRGKHIPKGRGELRSAGRNLSKIEGLSPKALADLAARSEQVEEASTNATNASSLTKTHTDKKTGEEIEVPGVFRQKNETQWLESELSALGGLRNHLIRAGNHINGPQKRIEKLMKATKNRLRSVAKHIHELERMKKKIEKQVRELETTQNQSTKAIEKEKNELEVKLQKAEKAKNKGAMKSLRAQIKQRGEAVSETGKETSKKIHEANKEIHGIERKVRGDSSVKEGLEEVVPSLEERSEAVKATAESLDSGGTYKNMSFLGLDSVQGKGSSRKIIKHLDPTPGSLAGEIFQVQLQLATLAEPKEPVTADDSGPSQTDQELLAIANEQGIEWKKKYLAGQYQQSVLRGFPTVAQATSVPYAGNFARGGVVAATVGENGPEVAFMPEGSRVVSNGEAKNALAGGKTTLVIEELTVNTEDGTATVKANGETFEAEVKNVNKRQGRKSQSITPGGL